MSSKCLAANLSSDDLTKLVESKTIQIKCRTKKTRNKVFVSQTITIPETLACVASKKLKQLCSCPTRRVFTADDILGEPVADFEARLIAEDFHTYVSCFVKWCYGASLDNEDGWAVIAVLRKIWDQADFSEDLRQGCGLENDYKVYWENKKMLKFALDLFVYGRDNWDTGNVLKAGGHLAAQLGKRMGAGGLNSAAWLEKNFDKYLVDEDEEY